MAELSDPSSEGHGRATLHPVVILVELAWMGLIATAMLVSVGLPLAVAGAFRPIFVFPLAISASVLLRVRLKPPSEWTAEIGAAHASRTAVWVVLGVLVVVGVGNMRWAGQHHATNRDPGVYLESGLWLGQHETLLVDGRTGPFLDDSSLRGGGSGFNEIGDGTGRLTSQFPHGTAVMIAAAEQLGGISLATRVGGLLIALAGLLLWIVTRRFVGDWWSTLAVAIFSVDLVTIHFARDTFSEPLAAVLVLGLLSLVLWSGRPWYWAFAGLLTGLTIAARIDSILVVLGVSLVVLAVVWVNQRAAAAMVVGTFLGFSLAMVDLVHRSPNYLSDKWPVFKNAMLVSLAIVAAAGALAGARRVIESRGRSARIRTMLDKFCGPGFAGLAGALVTTTILILIFVRPHLQQLHGGLNGHIRGLQQRDGLTVDGTRTYGESSLTWLTWYFGWPLVILGAVGAGLATRAVIHGRSREWATLGAIAGPVTVVYLQSPRISGDQIWAMRRFLPIAIPLLIILAVHAASVVGAKFGNRARFGAVAVLAASLILPGLVVTVPLANDQTLWWSTDSISGLCDQLPESSAVLVSSAVEFGDQLIRPLSRACNVPTARGDLSSTDIDRLTREWVDSGRRMVVVTSVYDPPTALRPLDTVGLLQRHLIQVVERRPDSFEEGILGVTISESDTASAGR